MYYDIELYYRTGDSFESKDIHDRLGVTWKDLDLAKENLERIKQHYLYYRQNNSWVWADEPKHKKPKFYKSDTQVILLLDNEVEWVVNCSWIGHFESLHGGKIVITLGENSEFTV